MAIASIKLLTRQTEVAQAIALVQRGPRRPRCERCSQASGRRLRPAALLAAAVCVVAGAISMLFPRADTTVEAHTKAPEAGTRAHVAEVIPTA